MAGFNEISPQALMRLIGTGNCPALIDVCIDADFEDDPYLIPTAKRYAHQDMEELAIRLAGRPAIIICQKGRKLSHGVAALLRSKGHAAQVLAGGNRAWKEAALPQVPAAAIPGQLWVTRHRPRIDRITCPWLIRRFVAPDAGFLFVPPAEVTAVAERFKATPSDIEGTFWGHRGDKCSFDTMVDEFGLSHPALDTLATLVRAADTNRHDLSVEAAGLHAISVGLSRMEKDDNAQLDIGLLLYDALYRWARDGQDEIHDN